MEMMKYGSSSTFVAFQASLGGLSAHVGWSETESNAPGNPTSNMMHVGAGGALGDTGLSWVFQMRDLEDDTNPWVIGVTKSLGGGSSLHFEHANYDNDDDESETVMALKVDF